MRLRVPNGRSPARRSATLSSPSSAIERRRLVRERALGPQPRRQPQRVAEEPVARPRMSAEDHVVGDAQGVEESDVLEGPRDAEVRDLVASAR